MIVIFYFLDKSVILANTVNPSSEFKWWFNDIKGTLL